VPRRKDEVCEGEDEKEKVEAAADVGRPYGCETRLSAIK